MSVISVIIPTHNRIDILPRAIRSVQAQTRPVDEIIVVSDGSEDGTEELVRKLSEEDRRICLISYYPGVNGNYARNRGIEASHGEYVAFLDDDDEWLPEKTEKQMAVFESDAEIGLVYSGQNCIYEALNIRYHTKPSYQGDLSKRIFLHSDPGTTSQVMLRRSVLEQTGGFDTELEALQDYDLWIRCCQLTKVGFVYDPCINYYNATGRKQVSENTDRYINAQKRMLDKYRTLIEQFDMDFQSKIYAGKKASLAKRCMRNGDGKRARAFLRQAWKLRPSRQFLALYGASFLPYGLVLRVRGKFKY